MGDARMQDRLFIGLQHLMPQHALSRLMRAITRVRARWFRLLVIKAFLRMFTVNLTEAEHDEPGDYGSFNEFFTRALKPGARPVDREPDAVVSPADGAISQLGSLQGDSLLQAKGLSYSLLALLGADEVLARQLEGGTFATIYLAPFNYHRVHMPLAGTLRRTRYIPGDLYSVNAATAAGVPGLFTRNERIACTFDTPAGPMAVVLVGALFVGSMSLAWAGEVTSSRPRRAVDLAAPDPLIALDRGAELGRFNMGSTVILLFGPGRAAWLPRLAPGHGVRMGERIATLA